MDAPLPSPDALVRPWRTATLVASLVAAIELVLLVGAALMLLAKPLAHAVQRHAEAAALAPAAPAKKAHGDRAQDQEGAAGEAHPVAHRRLRPERQRAKRRRVGRGGEALGARLPRAAARANAKRQDYATTVVMYRRGWDAEGRRLARDLHVKIVGPLDGMSSSSLHGAQLVVVLGAR